MSCADTQRFVQVYLDGEFSEHDRVELEAHLSRCRACRETVLFEENFRHAIRDRLRPPKAPAELRARVLHALDDADQAGSGPVPRLWRRALPVVVAAAAAVCLVAGGLALLGLRAPGRAMVQEAIRVHQKNLPVEVNGGEDRVREFFSDRVPVAVRLPRIANASAALVGGRLATLHGHDAAQLFYRVNQSPLTVHVFDAAGEQLPGRRRLVDGHEVWVDGERGYNVVLFRDRGVGYAFTSELDENAMLELVSASLMP